MFEFIMFTMLVLGCIFCVFVWIILFSVGSAAVIIPAAHYSMNRSLEKKRKKEAVAKELQRKIALKNVSSPEDSEDPFRAWRVAR